MGRRVKNMVPVESITKIVELTREGCFRKDIARKVGVSTFTVFKYQKLFDLV